MTMRDVAIAAGVSPKTVSNVVNDYVHVRPETRALVQRYVEELGYRPQAVGRQLRRGRTGAIALAVPHVDMPYFADLAALLAGQRVHDWVVGDQVAQQFQRPSDRPPIHDHLGHVGHIARALPQQPAVLRLVLPGRPRQRHVQGFPDRSQELPHVVGHRRAHRSTAVPHHSGCSVA